MEPLKKLAEYLADRIEYACPEISTSEIQEAIQDGLGAFEKTEGVKIHIQEK